MRKIKMTNEKWGRLFNTLTGIKGSAAPGFKYGIGYNVGVIEKVAKAIDKAKNYNEDDPDFKAYISESNTILQTYAVDKDGNPDLSTDASGNPVRRIPADKISQYALSMEQLN